MLVRGLAAEWGPHGIRVNAFNPGYTNHSMTEQGQAYLEQASSEIIARTPLRRMAEMREMVGPAVFLASDAASFVTGTICSLMADGARSEFRPSVACTRARGEDLAGARGAGVSAPAGAADVQGLS